LKRIVQLPGRKKCSTCSHSRSSNWKEDPALFEQAVNVKNERALKKCKRNGRKPKNKIIESFEKTLPTASAISPSRIYPMEAVMPTRK
jgi:hypothetical protein